MFGLGDPEKPSAAKTPVARTPSQPDPLERDQLLKKQAKDSPWLVCIHDLIFSGSAKNVIFHNLVKGEIIRGAEDLQCTLLLNFDDLYQWIHARTYLE